MGSSEKLKSEWEGWAAAVTARGDAASSTGARAICAHIAHMVMSKRRQETKAREGRKRTPRINEKTGAQFKAKVTPENIDRKASREGIARPPRPCTEHRADATNGWEN